LLQLILEGEDVGTLGSGGVRALTLAIMISFPLVSVWFTNGPYTQLRYIRIWKQEIGNEGAAAIASLLQASSGVNIAYLELLDCGIGEDGCRAIADVLSLQKAPGLLTLNLDYNLEINDAGVNVLFDGLFNNTALKNIEALTAFRDALIRSKALAHVDFTFNLIEPDGANVLLPALTPENVKLQSFLVDASLPGDLFQQLNRARKAEGKKKGKKGGGKKKKK
ncbi:hypothetical protein JG687_00002485, partial [Phytophthora cactorum]